MRDDISEVWDTDDIDEEMLSVDLTEQYVSHVVPVIKTMTPGAPAVWSARASDPFSPRDGKTLAWTNVNMTLASHGDKPERMLLSGVWGEVPQHATTAIMGPSGAGKTCLLNVLSGRASSRGFVTVKADVRYNNYSVNPTNIEVRHQIAFVAQDDSLQITATPREAIRFSAKLRLPRDTSDAALDSLTQRMITDLGLTSCADTIVGGDLIKGISGGERKRTSVGVELVVKPKMVFLDEPTSGLDSYSAVQLIQVLKKVAKSGASVLFTIHQPSSEIFDSIDNLILMNKGRVMYEGKVSCVSDYFEEHGYPVPPRYNPADWIMNVAQSVPVEELDAMGFFPVDERQMGVAFTPNEGQDALGITIIRPPKVCGASLICDDRPPGVIVQTTMLFKREIRNLQRHPATLRARFVLTTLMSILVSVIFLDVGSSDPSIASNLQSHFGALIMMMMLSMFGTALPSLLAFPEERPVFLREYSSNHYAVVSYFVSRLTMEAFITAWQVLLITLITFWLISFQGGFLMFWATSYALAMTSTALAVLLGCSVEESKLALELLPMLFVPQLLFAGFFVTPSLIPVWLRWARYLCSLTYAVRILLVEEFKYCSATVPGCIKLVDDVGAHSDETWWNWLLLVLLFALFRIGALIVLRKKATKFF